jgi:hypothetical protein
LKLSVADVIAAELQVKPEVLKFKNLSAICDGLRILLAGVSVVRTPSPSKPYLPCRQ